MIPYGRQSIGDDDVEAVIDALKSDFLTQGPRVPAFEESIKRACGSPHAIAVNSATSALHIACLALDVGPGDYVWTSPNSFVASANCALYCGAQVDFVDIDPSTYNMCATALKKKLLDANAKGKLPKVVIPVHMCGQSPEMDKIRELSRTYDFKIIEDASHSIGASYKGRRVGSCDYSDICVFSFHPVKIVTTAEGGVATTQDPKIAARLQRLRTHGITRDPTQMKSTSDGPWYYEQIELGLNYRMTELQAALGVSQMNRLDDFVDRRRELAERYHERLAELPLDRPHQHTDSNSSWHLYVINLQLDVIRKSHKEVFVGLRDNGIGVNLHYIPIHTQPFYQDLGFKTGDFPNAEAYYRKAISLPVFQDMSDDQQDEVIEVLSELLR